MVWSPKGGSGASVVSAALALEVARGDRSVLLVDLAGDQCRLLGLEATPGAGEWIASPDAPADGLAALEVHVGPGLRVLPRGTAGPDDPVRRSLLLDLCALRADRVIVDAGSVAVPWWSDDAASIAVVRSCYLGVRRLMEFGAAPDDVVLVEEPGRALGRRDVEGALGRPVHRLSWDPAVARAVDAGVFAARRPRSLRGLRPLASAIGER
ncbi:MAG: hypothetical protein AAF548_09595 [Actinomycetota bacterium]